MSSRHYTTAAIHYEPMLLSKERNVAALVHMTEEAAKTGARLITTPELGTTGYSLSTESEASSIAETVPGPTTDRFRAVARTHDVHIVIGMAEFDQETGLFYNSAVLIGPNGVVGRQRKTHLRTAELRWSAPGGHGHQVFDSGVGRIALLISTDVHFMEAANTAVSARAEVICHIGNRLDGRTPAPYWTFRAHEGSCYVVESAPWGLPHGVSFSGGSRTIQADGVVTTFIDCGNAIAYAQLDLDAVGPGSPAVGDSIATRSHHLKPKPKAGEYLWNPADFLPSRGDLAPPHDAASVSPLRSAAAAGSWSAPHELERLDRHLLMFALRWAPYGEPPEDECFTEFGMTAPRVREACVRIACTAPPGFYNKADYRLLVSISRLLARPTVVRAST